MLLLATLALATGALARTTEEEVLPSSTSAGLALYDRFCLACHGIAGDGRGPGAPLVWPQPRDFRKGDYKWRTTASGRPPTDEDLARELG